MVTHTCNPSFSQGGDWQDRGLRTAWCSGYGLAISPSKLGMTVCVCDPSYTGGIGPVQDHSPGCPG
jgi:hypothetical protein